jgi:hypothetical protein
LEVKMKTLGMGIVLLAVASLMVTGCLPSQAGEEGGVVVSPEAPRPVATGTVGTEPVGTEPVVTGADMMPEGPDYTPAAEPGGVGGGISDVLGGGGLAIVYERSGGFAGVMERTEIYRDGRVVVSEDGQVKEWQVPGARVGALLSLVDMVDLAGLGESGPSSLGGQGADRFAYSLTVVRDGTPVQVSWAEGQSGVPTGLLEVVAAIQELIQSAQ